MGWSDFPSEDESLDRAHFFQAYRVEVRRMLESEGGTAGNTGLCPGTARECDTAVRAGVEKVGGEDGEMRNFYDPAKLDCRTEERVWRIVELSCRRDFILEARSARELEKELGRDVLCPVALDYAWKDCKWPAMLREQIMEYNILDFSKWEDEEEFGKMFRKVVDGLDLFYKEG